MTDLDHMDALQEVKCRVCENEKSWKFEGSENFSLQVSRCLQSIYLRVPYQLELQVRQANIFDPHRYASSNPVSLIKPQILLQDVMLKQSGAKAKQNEERNQKLSHWKLSLSL